MIETDDEFVALLRERFGSRPYSNNAITAGVFPEYWTPERYEELIAKLVERQREIRAAAVAAPARGDDLAPDAYDEATLRWAIWSIQTHDVGASPTHWHRVWGAIQSAIAATRADERRRIGEALRADNAASVGPTATALIEAAVVDGAE